MEALGGSPMDVPLCFPHAQGTAAYTPLGI